VLEETDDAEFTLYNGAAESLNTLLGKSSSIWYYDGIIFFKVQRVYGITINNQGGVESRNSSRTSRFSGTGRILHKTELVFTKALKYLFKLNTCWPVHTYENNDHAISHIF
jgi:hypothetical protein